MLDIQVKTENLSEVTKAVLELPGIFARAKRSALKSLGYSIKQQLQIAGREASKGGYLNWEPLHPITGIIAKTTKGRYINFRKTRKQGTNQWKRGTSRSFAMFFTAQEGGVIQNMSGKTEPFTKFIPMIRYDVDEEDNLVEIGFLNSNARFYQYLRLAEQGFTRTVTARFRRYAFAIGFPLKKSTTSLKIPPRPWVKPVGDKIRPQAGKYFEQKFWQALERYRSGASKS